MSSYFFESALLPDGWYQGVRVSVSEGRFQQVQVNTTAQPSDQVQQVVIPQMPNCHSHVFQRAMAGLSEYHSQHDNDFWSWRDLMYKLANEMTIESLYETAKACYLDMKKAGYSSVCEFHYVHRSQANPDDYISHSKVILQAAHEVGLGITLLPVLYAYSAVGGVPLNVEQKRFELNVDEYLDLHQQLQPLLKSQQKLGICFHSIRAVDAEMMKAVLAGLADDIPVHIHIAEQQGEIEQSLAHYGQRPVAWLLDNFEVNQRWCLVHATHLDESEIKGLANSGAVAGLCPLTEANLGDGVFPLPEFMAHQGSLAIGSDSHIEINPAEELKMLEYSQRLQRQQRNVACDPDQPHSGTWMWLSAVKGGSQASGLAFNGIQEGAHAGVISLLGVDSLTAEQALDAWVFSDWLDHQSLDL